nr:MAG TPA: hypothetical protein [Caudoviricetes sp.]
MTTSSVCSNFKTLDIGESPTSRLLIGLLGRLSYIEILNS